MRRLAVPLATLVLCLSVPAARADDAEDKAVEVIENGGARVTRDEQAPGRPVVQVDFQQKVTDEDLKALAALKHLKVLLLDETSLCDSDLKHLAGLPTLEELDVGSTSVADAGLKHLAGLTNLQKL